MSGVRHSAWVICGWLASATTALAQSSPAMSPTFPAQGSSYFPLGINLAPFRPSAELAFGGGYDLLGGYARAALTAPQPTGHEIVPTGPNGYIFRPTFVGSRLETGGGRPEVGSGVRLHEPTAVDKAAAAANMEHARAVDDFRAGHYDTAVQATEQLIVAEPRDGFAHLLQSHALFAQGRWQEASDALHRALWVLPESDWRSILADYRDFYRATRYTHHLRDLEQFVMQQPNDPAGRFLLGYHYGYLGYRNAGAQQMETAVELAQVDELAQVLLDRFGGPAAPAAPASPAPAAPIGKPVSGPKAF